MSQSCPGTGDRLRGGESRLTVDVNWFEGCVSIGSTTTRRGGGAVLSLFLSDVGGPVLSHHGADDDVEHRVLDVLLDESEESGVVDLGRVNGGLVLVGFSVQDDLRASNANRKKRKNRVRTSENRKIQTRLEGGRQKQAGPTFQGYSPARVQVSVTDRVNPILNRTAREVICRIRSRQHRGLDTATSVVAHDDNVSDAQKLNTVRQNADRVVVDRLKLVCDVPLGEERAGWRGEDRTL
jgi:hypothetical protein